MSLPSRQLFLDRFMEYNRIRYEDDPESLARLEALTVEDIVFEGFTVDPDRPEGYVANFTVVEKAIEAWFQHWIPVPLTDDNILIQSEVTPAESLEQIIFNDTLGLYEYVDPDTGPTTAIVMDYRSDIPIQDLAIKVATFLTERSNYQILSKDLFINYDESTDDYRVFDLRNDCIGGKVYVVKLKNSILAGNHFLGYMGDWLPEDVIRPSVFADMMGMPPENVINPDSNWLKFSVEGRVIYVSKLPVSNMFSYNELLGLHLTDQERVIDIGQDQYRVRLLEDDIAWEQGSEWDRVMYRVSEDDPTGTFWARFTDAEIGVAQAGPGQFTMTQTEANATSVYGRGYDSLTYRVPTTFTTKNSNCGWRPVLQYVGTVDITFDPSVVMKDVVPVEHYDITAEGTDFFYSVGPVTAELSGQPTDVVEYSYADTALTVYVIKVSMESGTDPTEGIGYTYEFVYTAGSVKAAFDVTVNPTEGTGYELDYSELVTSVVVARATIPPPVDPWGYDVHDFVTNILDTGYGLDPDWVDEDVGNVELIDPFYDVRLGNTRPNPYALSGSFEASSTNTAAGVVTDGKMVKSADFVIESATFTGLDFHIPATDYLDLFEEPVYNGTTVFMSF